MSSSTEACISLTCHFLTSQWEFVDCVLATRSFPDHHMGENISSTIKEVLESYKIVDYTVSSIVHDQGSNMRQATDMFKTEKGWARVNRLAHILQLCISDGFKNNASIDIALCAARKLLSHFHYSTLATAELYKQQSQMNMNQRKPKIDCMTRWNSILYMIQHLVAITSGQSLLYFQILPLQKSKTIPSISQLISGFYCMEELSKLLEPLEVAIVFFCTERMASISCIFPIMYNVFTSMDSEEGDSASIIAF